ncbi:TIGR02680 family protein [Streptomyces johnsoniae]|uniref:TIGR02680 family protein n=1 Tax=Streptomyces johnsoniae TaxID=3075532 RepID=A0ABU2S5T1_9ACTN|nr:TIGR02680 family protein [Streptomyces sp. DSM 41886]MDT0443794.1 TIGR02680 family protein [Streptomyces sp. DSM 41886]
MTIPRPAPAPGPASAPAPAPAPEPSGLADALPSPGRPRWQPLRLGLVDLFYYDVEEFWFRDGRLLLRGNNGTGKSKVLALTLPFLLDGDLAAYRVEPDGDPKKRMEWNLLLGGEHPHPERLGYAWVEFGRLTESGGTEFRTLGCGLKAVKGRGIARHWFFVTGQRVGAPVAEGGLGLLDATRAALSRDRLAEAIEGHGMVYDQAKSYRRAVDEALFGLGEQRYAALVDLLIQLRQPQLSKRPSEAALSRALTEALPPMDAAIVADVAEAFRSLDEEKDNLAAMAEARDAAANFLQHYRRYARIAAKRKARPPRIEHSRYEHLQRELSQAQEQRVRADAARAAAERLLAELEERRTRLRAEDAALRAGPEMRSARELEQAASDASRTAADARRADGDRGRAAEQHARAQARAADAERRRDAAQERLAAALTRAAAAAAAAGIEDGHATRVAGALFGGPGVPGVPGAPGADETGTRGQVTDLAAVRETDVQEAAEMLADGRSRAVAHVEQLAEAAERAAADRAEAVRRAEEAAADLGAAADREAAARTEAAEAGRGLVADVRAHVARCAELRPHDPSGLLDQLQDWTGHLNGPSPARTAAEAAHAAASAGFAEQAAALRLTEEALTERRAARTAELTALEAGRQPGPPSPATRGEGVRTDRPGAPLWRLADFADGLPAADRAGLEAALEAGGLLDAWVLPDGTAVAPDTHDVLLAPDPAAPLPGPALSQVLRPAPDHGDARAATVSEEAVARLLAAIGYGEGAGATWVDAGGRFRVGVLRGAWTKDSAEYLGEGAREEARRVRITTLRSELDRLDGELAAVLAAVAETAARRRAADAELAALPDDSGLRRAHAVTAAATEAVDRARTRADARAGRAADATRRADAAAAELAETAADLRLSGDRAGLHAVREALGDYRLALAAAWPALRERATAMDAVAAEREEAGDTAARVAELTERAQDAARDATAAAERHRTLAGTVGAAVAELQRRLGEVAARLREADAEERRARREHTEAVAAQGQAAGRIQQLESGLAEAARTRGEAIAALRRFAGTGLLAVALPDLATPPGDGEWAPTAAVQLARAIDADLADADESDPAWERTQRRVNDELKNLQDALSRHGHTATGRMLEDGLVVDILFQGRERAVPDLADALTTEVAALQRMLSAREREILETHLITEVAGTLQDLIGTAERQVRRMNDELADRPTSTGMRLRLAWRPARSAPPGLPAARERLRQSADAWSPADRAAIGDFLQAEIARAQATQPAGTWLDHLTAALDYRAWHEFGIERHQHGQWRSATGPASGGERVLSVSVPLFAAASSHYATAANPSAPRLVTLDEAFAGVDDDSRAKCLGLLHAFDLDVVMTSEREWACYPEVPGIAIAQLSRIDEIAAVLVSRWEWDGTQRRRAPGPRSPDDPEPQVHGDQAGLWT